MILAKLITRKPIIFDAFLSLYDTVVLDRGLAKNTALKPVTFGFWIGCHAVWPTKYCLTLLSILIFLPEHLR